MFKAQSKRKNSYLHRIIDHIEPDNINRNVCRALLQPINNPFDLNPPLTINVSLQPLIYAPNIDPSKAQLSYGDWGIPKLVLELHDKKAIVRSRALKTLVDELYNPEKCFAACKKFNLVRALSIVIQDMAKESQRDNLYIVERAIIIFSIIGTYLEIAKKIYEETETVNTFYSLIKAIDVLSVQTSRVFLMLTNHAPIADNMVNDGHLDKMLIVLKRVGTLPEFLNSVSNLIARNPEKAFQAGYFEFFIPLLNINHLGETMVVKCVALLLQSSVAQTASDKFDLIPKFIEIIRCPKSNIRTIEYAVMGLHNCLTSTKSRWRAREIWDLPIILISLAHNRINFRLQMHALQTLIHIIQMPSVKAFVQKVCKSKIKNICGDPEILSYKKKLLTLLRSSKYRHPQKIEENDNKKSDDKDDVSCGDIVEEPLPPKVKSFPYRIDPCPSPPLSGRLSVNTVELMKMLPQKKQYKKFNQRIQKTNKTAESSSRSNCKI